ncbi:MAG: hypothetical protein U1F24_00815 [Alphaproteobacteria bacterium]
MASWIAAMPTAGAGLNQHRLAGFQAAELEEAFMCRAERNQDGRGDLDVHAVRHRPGGARRDDAQFGVAAKALTVTTRWPGSGVADLAADFEIVPAA